MSDYYGSNFKFSPPGSTSSTHISPFTESESYEWYLENLLEEKKKVAFYAQESLPICNKLLNQEIMRIYEMMANQDFNDFERLQLRSPNLSNHNLSGWDGIYPIQHQETLHGPAIDPRSAAQGSWGSLPTKKLLRLDVPVDRFPDFNFVGRLLGPRGNSLKRIEALTGCRVFIRGRGSMKDPDKEERLRGRPGHGHLNEPLHILIEAESPANVVDVPLRQAKEIIEELLIPVNYSGDLYKKQQLRELAMLKSIYGDDTCQPSSSSGAKKRTTPARKGTL